MEWYDFIIFGLAVIAATGYGYLEGHRAGFLKGVRAGFLKGVRAAERKASGQQQGE